MAKMIILRLDQEIHFKSHAWTDSTIVLQWLAQLPRTWNTFVANRVSQIQETLPRSDPNDPMKSS